MHRISPWERIPLPKNGINVRQIYDNSSSRCYWGRDNLGNYLFIIELEGDHTELFRKTKIEIKGVNLDLRLGESGLQRLVITLEKKINLDLFESLCQTLAKSSVQTSDSQSALSVTLQHLRRWKVFLAGKTHALSPAEVRGLFAELSFLIELIDNKMLTLSALNAWLGPNRSHQDFVFGDTAVEVKAMSGSERSKVTISSEDQLESLNSRLFLRIYLLSGFDVEAEAKSLNQLVDYIYTYLDDSDEVESFESKLSLVGYAPIHDYDTPSFLVNEIQTYSVSNGFPRLTRSSIPKGLSKVSYDIYLEDIASFECETKEVFGGLK